MYSVQLFCLKEVICPAFTGMKHTFSSPQPPQWAGKPLAEAPNQLLHDTSKPKTGSAQFLEHATQRPNLRWCMMIDDESGAVKEVKLFFFNVSTKF